MLLAAVLLAALPVQANDDTFAACRRQFAQRRWEPAIAACNQAGVAFNVKRAPALARAFHHNPPTRDDARYIITYGFELADITALNAQAYAKLGHADLANRSAVTSATMLLIVGGYVHKQSALVGRTMENAVDEQTVGRLEVLKRVDRDVVISALRNIKALQTPP